MIFSLSEDDFDSVINVHLKGTFAPLHHAAIYWRERTKAGEANDARVINTASLQASMAISGKPTMVLPKRHRRYEHHLGNGASEIRSDG